MIIFENPGLIDTDAAFTMGVNVKDGDAPIGYFGTGLKFAIATVLRIGGSITIYRGEDEMIELCALDKNIRGKDFKMVNVITHGPGGSTDPVALGFTTDLGKGWEPWMAFRELACNALDEKGSYYSSMGIPERKKDCTLIVVNCREVEDAYNSRDGILAEGQPIYADARFEVRTGETNYIFYRGVRIGHIGKKMTHSYNLLSPIELTEDRTFKSEWEVLSAMGEALIKCDDKSILKRALACGERYLEHGLDLPSWMAPSPAFRSVAGELREDMSHGTAANPSALKLARQHRISKLGPEDGVRLCKVDEAKLEKAKEALARAGYDVDEYPITVVKSLGPGNMGLASEGRIFLSMIPFEKGTKEVACTLLEEYGHLHTGFGDMTRGFQTWLFDQIVCQIERNTQEAL